jgi:hypothetical protein
MVGGSLPRRRPDAAGGMNGVGSTLLFFYFMPGDKHRSAGALQAFSLIGPHQLLYCFRDGGAISGLPRLASAAFTSPYGGQSGNRAHSGQNAL